MTLHRLFTFLALCLFLIFPLTAQAEGEIKTYPIDHIMGQADAPITIIEYASTTCGHCASFISKVLPQLKKDWIDTGKAKLIYRDFPTSPPGLSLATAMLPHCAGPERYFPVLSLIMANQEEWFRSEDRLTTLKKMVGLAGMSGEEVDNCLSKKQDLAEAIINRATDGADLYGIEATPTAIINGEVKVGLIPYDELNEMLKALE